ncbi:ABC transporter ATP-binding protein [Neobacillus vireti]|uniref:ABC transporter ATP-binding protein n=1 Tax=Neobacillus vireti LMG 21834 TaxID=1131730 RepID=A0AB94IQ68_9BACI|nr:ABC transporter ATP-binding protein [Neobacillus vireti]ETI69225.1 ABC transporter ATP-binding protein [Neobacillus vireti LMG 21834]KLT18964.1 mannosyltransferase [Neobacillus vireti]
MNQQSPRLPDSPMIDLQGVTKEFLKPSGEVHTVLRNINLRVAKGEFCSIVGPTGCGKSTTLSLIAGFEAPSLGKVQIKGEKLEGINSRASCVFQTENAFPWKTVIDNVSLGLRLNGTSKNDAFQEARRWIEKVGLKGFEGHYPHQLSGGMRKRVALAQCLITQPEILLMDESFSALDVHTRHLMENELLKIWEETSASVFFITHDLEEAIALSDRVIVLTAGPAATIKGDYRINLERPRNVAEIRFDKQFAELHEQIWNDLRDEVMVSYASANNA